MITVFALGVLFLRICNVAACWYDCASALDSRLIETGGTLGSFLLSIVGVIAGKDAVRVATFVDVALRRDGHFFRNLRGRHHRHQMDLQAQDRSAVILYQKTRRQYRDLQ